jgi:Flp pilus assembly protein TadG
MTRPTLTRGRRASALAEFCFCVPFLFMMLCAATEFGFMIYNFMEIEDAARDGARMAAKGFDDATVTARVSAYFPIRYLLNPTVLIQEFDTAGAAISPTKRVPGSRVKVTVSIAVQWLTPIQALFGGQALGMAASATFRVENP